MVASRLWLLKSGDWKELAFGDANPGSSAANHAERSLFLRYESVISSAGIAAFVQDGAPCDSCHQFFKDKSLHISFIFAIGKCGSGKAQRGTGYPALKGTHIIPTVLDEDGNEVNAVGFSEFVIRAPKLLDPASLPVLMYYHSLNCYMGGLPEKFPRLGADKLQTLLDAAS